MTVCSNCESGRHASCCLRCGGLIRHARRGFAFCTVRCERTQAREDAASVATGSDDDTRTVKKLPKR